jgi:hypothetical protein
MKEKYDKKKDPFKTTELAATAVESMPETSFQMVNKYGTYNIQPTNDSDNEFPEIAQGLPKAKRFKELEPEWKDGR